MCARILIFDVGIKNLSFIDILIREKDKLDIVAWECVSIIDRDENTSKIGINNLTDSLLTFLFERFGEKNEYNKIYIENQPALINGLMKSMSMVIYTYFKMHMPLNFVHFINASNKLKCLKAKTRQTKKITYNQRKAIACEITNEYLDTIAPDKKEWFSALKKKDDYADTFLYAMYIFENNLY